MNKRTMLTVALLTLATHGTAATPGALEDCPPTIIELSRKMEAFDLKCRGGYVAQFCLSDKKRPWPDYDFFAANVLAFGLKSKDVFDCEKHPCQQWKGVPISPGLGFSEFVGPDHKTKCMNVFVVDTRSWTVETTPKISSTTAANVALGLWKAEGPRERFTVDITRLEIRRGPPPRLIWSVGAIWHTKWDTRLMCDIDALKPSAHWGCSLKPVGEIVDGASN